MSAFSNVGPETGPRALAERLGKLSSSPTMAVMAEAERLRREGAAVVNFAAGEPDFPTPGAIKDAGVEAIRSNFTRYTLNPGTPELRQSICDRYLEDYEVQFELSETIATNGGKHALFDLMMTLLDPGDEVIIPSPHWKTFSEQVRIMDAVPVFVETREAEAFCIRAERVAEAITGRTKLVVVNSPSNPTGAVIQPEDFRRIGELAGHHGFYLLWDDAYGKLIFEEPPREAVRWLRENLADRFIIAGTVSKSYAMTGWRLGWALGPREVISGCAKLQSHMTSHPSAISQHAAIEALTAGKKAVEEMVHEYRWRRDRLRAGLLEIEGVSCVEPRGGFYLFPGVHSFIGRKGKDSVELARRLLLDAHVAVVPGSAFDCDGHLRVSFATSREQIEEGLQRLRRFFG